MGTSNNLRSFVDKSKKSMGEHGTKRENPRWPSQCVRQFGPIMGEEVLLSPCRIYGIVGELPVDFRWSVKISLRRGVPKEQDVAVLDVLWPLPSSLASGPRGVHFQP